jgi:undecaprenyl diphosphate synthase
VQPAEARDLEASPRDLHAAASTSPGPVHVGIIMDGNGRWAEARGLPRRLGHRAGAKAVRRTLEAAPALGIDTLTLYAFSCDNWRRPAPEVDALMALFESYLGRESARAAREGLRLSVIGRRDRLRPALLDAIADAEATTAEGRRLHLRIALDYSGREAILAAAARLAAADGGVGGRSPVWPPDRHAFERKLEEAVHSPAGVPGLDLVIRTGGEKRLSDFLLWESAYAELYFTDRLWPDFAAGDLEQAVAEFRGRERRFGALARLS